MTVCAMNLAKIYTRISSKMNCWRSVVDIKVRYESRRCWKKKSRTFAVIFSGIRAIIWKPVDRRDRCDHQHH